MPREVDGLRISVIMSDGKIRDVEVIATPNMDVWGLLETNFIDEHWEMLGICGIKHIKITTTMFDDDPNYGM